jgi:D-3-phosphoglycerate dehydrogenase / 2-oxoglutarate reductase
MKVVVTDYIEDNLDWEAKELAKAGLDFSPCQLKFKSEEEVLAAIGDADIILVNMVKMTDSIISRLPRCRLLIRHGIGYDNVDVASCTKHGIPFAYQPDYCTEDVAEHAIALFFACVRKVQEGRASVDRSIGKPQWDFTGVFPISRMQGKTLGILGVGRIGARVAQKLSGFGFRILGHDPYMDAARKSQLAIEWVDRETIFRESDFLTIHTPLNDETRHIVNATTLGLMKRTAFLVNTARGGMVDVDALAATLKAGRLAGAGLDVYDREPPLTDFPVYGMPNVLLTPHTAWASEESGLQIRKNILADMLACAAGKPPRYQVNKGVPARAI